MTYFPEKEWSNRAMMKQTFIDRLESFRGDLGYAITITADYATSGHAPKSLHGEGKAIDGTTESPLWDFISKAIKHGFKGIGIYLRDEKISYFHLDDRDGAPQFWVCEVTNMRYIYKVGK